jgi:hypothetical protein
MKEENSRLHPGEMPHTTNIKRISTEEDFLCHFAS